MNVIGVPCRTFRHEPIRLTEARTQPADHIERRVRMLDEEVLERLAAEAAKRAGGGRRGAGRARAAVED